MDKVSWLVPIEAAIKELLADRKAVLESWRRAVGTKRDGMVRKFENWLAVEPVHRLTSPAEKICFNNISSMGTHRGSRGRASSSRRLSSRASDDAAGWAVDARGDRLAGRRWPRRESEATAPAAQA